MKWTTIEPGYTFMGINGATIWTGLQRHSHVQEERVGKCCNQRVRLGIDEKDGETITRGDWENNSFYNVQPCCVFPHNPGGHYLRIILNNLFLGRYVLL